MLHLLISMQQEDASYFQRTHFQCNKPILSPSLQMGKQGPTLCFGTCFDSDKVTKQENMNRCKNPKGDCNRINPFTTTDICQMLAAAGESMHIPGCFSMPTSQADCHFHGPLE